MWCTRCLGMIRIICIEGLGMYRTWNCGEECLSISGSKGNVVIFVMLGFIMILNEIWNGSLGLLFWKINNFKLCLRNRLISWHIRKILLIKNYISWYINTIYKRMKTTKTFVLCTISKKNAWIENLWEP